MSDRHKAALAEGREQGRAVRRYLEVLASPVPANASAMPEAPNCPIYPADDVWHSNIQQMPVNPMSATWIANMGGPGRLLHPDFGGPYGYQLQVVDSVVDLRELEEEFVKAAPDYSRRKGITYAAWREAGIDPAVLRRAGIRRASGA